MAIQDATYDQLDSRQNFDAQLQQRSQPQADYSNGFDDGSRADRTDERLARGLGWFSIGLGLAELLAPRSFSRFIGVPENRVLLPLLGIRELAAGVGILSNQKPSSWMWSRVAGDMMDLALLGGALASDEADRGRITAAAAAVAGVTALDVYCSQQLSDERRAVSRTVRSDGSIGIRKSIAINRSPEECYAFWHDFQNLPRFMKHLESVQALGEKRSHWVATAPAGRRVEWDAEVVDDIPNQLITWRSVEGADVENSGSVHFNQPTNGPGTFLRVEMEYRPPAGAVGAMVAKLFGEEPEQQVYDDLRRFKQVLETGEIPTTEGQSSGRESMVTTAESK